MKPTEILPLLERARGGLPKEALAAEVEDAAEYDLEKRLVVMRASLLDGKQGGYGVR